MSNLTPRPPLPPPANPAICRVQPLVPDLSLFVPGQAVPPPPPQPHQPPTLQPQSDLSRQFNRTEATLFLSGSSSEFLPRKVQWSDQQSPQTPVSSHNLPPPPPQTPPCPASYQSPTLSQPAHTIKSPPVAPQPQSYQSPVFAPPACRAVETDWRSPVLSQPQPQPQVHPDILAVLNWQNEQLARLQDQVSRLLTASPAQSEASNTTRDVAVGSPVLRRAATVSTNTSSSWPPPPPSQADLLGGDMDLVSEASQVTPVKTQVDEGVGGAWESPVLGESVSMYERESELGSEREEQEMYENILGKVRKLLAQEETDQPPAPASAPASVPASVAASAPVGLMEQPGLSKVEEESEDIPNQTEATWQRLRQLGVSFISPGDLAPAGGLSLTEQQPYTSAWLPQAKQPTVLDIRNTPDSSLAINNLALKYLSDQELSKLATLHNKKENKGKLVIDSGGWC